MTSSRRIQSSIVGRRARGLLFGALALLLLPAVPRAAAAGPHPHYNDGGTLDWYTRIEDAQAAARASNRLVFIDSGRRRGCPNCKSLIERCIPHGAVGSRLRAIAVGYAHDCDYGDERLSAYMDQQLAGQPRILPFVGFVTPDMRWVAGWTGSKEPSEICSYLAVAERYVRGARASASKDTERVRAAEDLATQEAARREAARLAEVAEKELQRREAMRLAAERKAAEELLLAEEAGVAAVDAARRKAAQDAALASLPPPTLTSPALPGTAPGEACAPPPSKRPDGADVLAASKPTPTAAPAATVPSRTSAPTAQPAVKPAAATRAPAVDSAAERARSLTERAGAAAASGAWGEVLRIDGEASRLPKGTDVWSIQRWAAYARRWGQENLSAALKEASEGRLPDAMRILAAVRQEMVGVNPAGEDAMRGEQAVARLVAIQRGSPDGTASGEDQRRAAHAEFMGSRWVALFKASAPASGAAH